MVAEIFAWTRARATAPQGSETECGAVVVAHRFGTAIDRSVHVHIVALDGLYEVGDGELIFHPSPRAPSDAALRQIGERVGARVRGADHHPGGVPLPCMPAEPWSSVGEVPARAEVRGLTLMVGGLVDPRDRRGISQLIRRAVQPAVVLCPPVVGRGGRIRYRGPPDRAGPRIDVAVSPGELRAKLSAMEAERRAVVTYHGVLAPRALHRWRIVPAPLMSVPAGGAATARQAAWHHAVRFDEACAACGATMRVVAAEALELRAARK
ncbi:MAG: hypothetical protein AAF721_17090 [Myxococcota bacterium]